MLVVIIRTVIVLLLLVVVLRLMGKREIGQLQPFEFVITLIIAELACTPMQDVSIPITYGVVPLLAVFCIYFFTTKLSCKFIGFRKVVNGQPVIVVSPQGIDVKSLKKLNMHVNDLLQSMHQSEYFSVPEVKYAIVETNGTLTILPDSEAYKPQSIPVSVVIEGKYIDDNLRLSQVPKTDLDGILTDNGIDLKDVVLMSVYDGRVFVQPKDRQYIVIGGQK